MAFDEDLAARIRAILAVRPDASERRMFGLIAGTNATIAVMSDRPMTGGVRTTGAIGWDAAGHLTRTVQISGLVSS